MRLDPHRSWLLYSGGLGLALATAWTVAPIYFVREVGMSPLELVLAGTALEVAYFLAEVPTGAVADAYSRRASVVVGQVVMGAGFLLTGAVADVGVVLAAAALVGFGWTFRSGAEDAWLADEVGLDRVARSYQRGAQVERACSLVGIGAAVGLATVDLRLPLLVGGGLFVALGAALALVMPETRFRPAQTDELGRLRAAARTARNGGRLVRSRPVLLLAVAIAFFGGMWSEGVDRLWEAHLLLDVGVPGFGDLDPVLWFGVLNAGALLLALAAAQPLVPRFERAGRSTTVRILLVLDGMLVVATLVFALTRSFALAAAAFWTIGVVRSLARPVFSTWVNASVDDSRVRATAISITYLGDSAGEWGGGPALGAVGSAHGIRAALSAGALALLPALPLYGRALRSERAVASSAAVVRGT